MSGQPVPPLARAPEVLTVVVLGAGALLGVAVALAARWGARQARTARAVAEAAGQLVVVRPLDVGPCTPICVPPRLASLLAGGDLAAGADTLPPWRPDVHEAIEALRARVLASPSQSATMECALIDRRLRLVGARIGDGDRLLVSLAEAGPDVARYNRLESAALLARGVAHDLLNLLSRLVMHAELGAGRAQPSELRAHLERIALGGGRAAELVSLMRRYLRGERSAGAEPVAPAAIVVEVVELLRPAMPSGIALDLALDPSCAVHAEPAHVHQVVLNVVTNAVQALDGRPAPRLTISVAPGTPVSSGTPGASVELVVVDNGPGLSAVVRERLFEPYVTTRAAQGGEGLGLAVVRALVVDVLGGTVRADDAPGGGTRVTVRLPALVAAGVADAAEPHEPAEPAAAGS